MNKEEYIASQEFILVNNILKSTPAKFISEIDNSEKPYVEFVINTKTEKRTYIPYFSKHKRPCSIETEKLKLSIELMEENREFFKNL